MSTAFKGSYPINYLIIWIVFFKPFSNDVTHHDTQSRIGEWINEPKYPLLLFQSFFSVFIWQHWSTPYSFWVTWQSFLKKLVWNFSFLVSLEKSRTNSPFHRVKYIILWLNNFITLELKPPPFSNCSRIVMSSDMWSVFRRKMFYDILLA